MSLCDRDENKTTDLTIIKKKLYGKFSDSKKLSELIIIIIQNSLN